MGVYEKRLPMFARIEPDGIRWGNGDFDKADVILWATGFRASLDHLAPLHVRAAGGGIVMLSDDVSVAAAPGLTLVGYGPSASTLGATRAGRRAARAALALTADAAQRPSGTLRSVIH